MPVEASSIVAQGDIYWVNLSPIVGSEQAGRRPCVVVSRRNVNQAGRTVVVVPLSTKIEKANSYRILLPASEITRDLSSQSTIENSVALCDHIREIDKSRLQSKMGKLSQNAVFAVQLGLANIFDIR